LIHIHHGFRKSNEKLRYFFIAVLSTAMKITIHSAVSAARANLPQADKAGGE
jgi:hypothetical protein